MIAVTFALPSESCDFRRLLGGRHREVKILHTGVGAAIARTRLEPFLDSQRFDFLISSGFAGGTDPSLRPGDLFLSVQSILWSAGHCPEARLRPERALARFDQECRRRVAGGQHVVSTGFGTVSVEDLVRFNAIHTRHHCKQMAQPKDCHAPRRAS